MTIDPTAALHGRELSAADRRLLRDPPPQTTLAWCADAVGAGARVVAVTPLLGGTSSAVHALDVRTAAGRELRLALRRFVRAEWLDEEPDVPLREAAALEALLASSLPTPELVALDADGSASADVPALLMTRLPGSLVWAPSSDRLDAYLERLAAILPALHATPLPPGDGLGDYDDWGLRIDRPPAWSQRPDVWERAFAIFADPPPPAERALIHRDFHAGNVLFDAHGAVSAIVDWASTSVGSPDADVGVCRENLARGISLAAADRFLEHYGRLSGRGGYDPWWDVAAALGGLDDEDVAGWTTRHEAFLAQAVARRG